MVKTSTYDFLFIVIIATNATTEHQKGPNKGKTHIFLHEGILQGVQCIVVFLSAVQCSVKCVLPGKVFCRPIDNFLAFNRHFWDTF